MIVIYRTVINRRNFMSFSLDACKEYAGSLDEIAIDCLVTRHKKALETKINAICLEIGFLQAEGKSCNELLKKFDAELANLTTDSKEQGKLRTYGNRLLDIGKQFHLVTHTK